MKTNNFTKIFKLIFIVMLFTGLAVFTFKGEFKYFEGNDSVLVKFSPAETLSEDEITDSFNTMLSSFDSRQVSSVDRIQYTINLAGTTRFDVESKVNAQEGFSVSDVQHGTPQSSIKSEYIMLSVLVSIFVIAYIFVMSLRRLHIKFKDFSIFAVKVVFLFLTQTISMIGLIALISRLYEIKLVDMYSIFLVNLVTTYILMKSIVLTQPTGIEQIYTNLASSIREDKSNLVKILVVFAILLPFGLGVKVISTLVFFLVSVYFAINSMELFAKLNIEGVRFSIPNRSSVSALVRDIRMRKTPILPLKNDNVGVISKPKKKTETKKKQKKEKNKNRR